LTTTNGSWSGTSPISYTYQWQDCTSSTNCNTISGATASTYTLTDQDVGYAVRSVVTATNVAGAASAYSALTAVVSAVPPTSTQAPAISGTAEDGYALTSTNGSWSGTSPISYTYQWQDCTSSTSCRTISGATASTYTLTDQDVGYAVRSVVTATNVAGAASAYSALTAVVFAVAPTNTTAPPAPSGSPAVGQLLKAQTGAWSGTAPITFTYDWQRCSPVAALGCSDTGVTSSRYMVGTQDLSDTLRVVITAHNVAGQASATSAQTTPVLPVASPVGG
jgi:hypothetical protein